MRAHWGLGSMVISGIFIPGASAEEVAALTWAQREGASAAVAGDLLEVYYGTDVRPLLPAIRARTAVLHREADPATAFRLGREVATLIPDATLIPLPGSDGRGARGEHPAQAGVRSRAQIAAWVTEHRLSSGGPR
ncbi:MAG TPA: hypothetical protein VGS06_28840 [Streptosporangiaceae bacterium]|nr:hypothetical protein [Streptosporangiaceae bacterium]